MQVRLQAQAILQAKTFLLQTLEKLPTREQINKLFRSCDHPISQTVSQPLPPKRQPLKTGTFRKEQFWEYGDDDSIAEL